MPCPITPGRTGIAPSSNKHRRRGEAAGRVDFATEVKHLGSKLSADLSDKADVTARVKAANQVFGALRKQVPCCNGVPTFETTRVSRGPQGHGEHAGSPTRCAPERHARAPRGEASRPHVQGPATLGDPTPACGLDRLEP